MRKTKIICTIGPSCDDYEVLKEMALAGMNCCRLNFSHGTHEDQLRRIENIKRLRTELNMPLPIMLDNRGPELRVGYFEDGFIHLKAKDTFTFFSDFKVKGTNKGVGISFPNLAKSVIAGTRIFVDDGKVTMIVKEVIDKDIVCEVQNDGKLYSHKSINVPNVDVKIPYLSEQDISDIEFGIENDVDLIAASFARSAYDILALRSLLGKHHKENIMVIAKIENMQGLRNADEILAVSDGLMVARGDLGVEISFERLPSIQKELISKCYRAGKVVVTATQMLESMTNNLRPTRAEVSDVANAVYDRTTCTMLSGETAAGNYPVAAVKAMSTINETAENAINFENRFYQNHLLLGKGSLSAICQAAVEASLQVEAKAIICVSKGGVTAKMLSAYQPKCPIIAAVLSEKSYQQMGVVWGAYAFRSEQLDSTDKIILNGIRIALESGIVKKGDTVVITSGSAIGKGATDMMQIHTV